MARKRKDKALLIKSKPGESKKAAITRAVLRPTLNGAATISEFGKWYPDELDLPELVKALGEQTKAVIDGDLNRGQAMLTVQAHTLDAIYNGLARRALNSELLNQFETHLKLALRAQSQCRSTWEAISAIQNPPLAGYIRQANIAHGHQQVNNASRAEENGNPPDELLEKTEHESDAWMGRGTPTTAERVDSGVEAVGEIDGTANGDGKE